MRHVKKDENTDIVEYYIEYETDTPHFQVFKLGISNNYDVQSPLGISAIANSIGTLENIDEKYFSSRMDSINSRKKVFVDEESTKMYKQKDASGNLKWVKYFDQDETQFQVLKGMAGGGERKAVEMYIPTYDSAQHDNAIQMELNYLSSKVGLGSNYYSFVDGAVGYQNEMNVIASNSDTFRNRKKNLNRLETVLVNMMKSIMYLEKDIGNYTGNLEELEYQVQFDDDIMTDDATVIEQYRKDAQDGIIKYEKYLVKAYGITEDEAKEITEDTSGVNIMKIKALSDATRDGVMSIKQVQQILNKDTLSVEEIELNYIETKIEKGLPITPQEAVRFEEITGSPINTPTPNVNQGV